MLTISPYLKIASWNVNSLRVRLPHVLTWLSQHQPDVLALQETKLIDEDFPLMELQQAGYSAIFSGQKTYNGVAILYRQQSTDTIIGFPNDGDMQKRVLGATIDGVRILNLYVPNGQSVGSDKYAYKLDWLRKLQAFLTEELQKYPKLVVVGDFNIAPADIDVHDPLLWKDQIHCSELERDAFQSVLKVGLKDSFRELSPSDPGFSWWDYRMNAFKRNRGLRIDHILVSDSLLKQCHTCQIDTLPRTWERPSDHAPITITLNRA